MESEPVGREAFAQKRDPSNFCKERASPRSNNTLGTPQGGVISPLLANIYLKELNGLKEAVHEVPRMLMSWNEGRLSEILIHFGSFHAKRFPGSPDLLAYFDRLLEEYKMAGQAGASDGDKAPN